MARFDQFLGLNSWAKKTVNATGVIKKPSNQELVKPTKGKFTGMFGDEYPLYMYTLPNGKVYFEEIQADPWSSGPVFFIALKNKRGNWIPRSLWSREKIDNC